LAPQIAIETLRERYHLIGSEFATAFTDGRLSKEYRLERMNELLRRSELDFPIADDLVQVYATSLENALLLQDSALELMKTLKTNGYTIAVISEGPHDAQEWTLQKLQLFPLIDVLMTSNREHISKKDGLFEIFMDRYQIERDRVVLVGDSVENDIIPASKAGLKAIHFNPKNQPSSPAASFTIAHLTEVTTIIVNLT
jgi:putative hydrolase of the HAD superfamily